MMTSLENNFIIILLRRIFFASSVLFFKYNLISVMIISLNNQLKNSNIFEYLIHFINGPALIYLIFFFFERVILFFLEFRKSQQVSFSKFLFKFFHFIFLRSTKFFLTFRWAKALSASLANYMNW